MIRSEGAGLLFYPINKAAIDKNETYNWECVVLCTSNILQDCCVHKCHVEVIVCTSWVYTHPRDQATEVVKNCVEDIAPPGFFKAIITFLQKENM